MSPRPVSLAAFDRDIRREVGGLVAGVDEAGRGCLAGPVVAAAVVLGEGIRLPGVTDSKLLTAGERADCSVLVRSRALAWGVSFVGPRTIDGRNIRQATLIAMRRAYLRARTRWRRHPACEPTAGLTVLVDGLDVVPGLDDPQRAVVDGDARSLAIAAASILAKTARDGFMIRLAAAFPGYGFEQHKGYATEQHLAALERLGPCRWHRLSFHPVAQLRFVF